MKKILLLLILSVTISGFAQDGSLDTSFNQPTGARNGDVTAAVLQSDGKIIVGGTFTILNNLVANKLARLNTDGTIDITFNSGSGFNNTVNDITVQPDGKIIVVGNFTTYNGISKNRIVRLNTDGTVDSTFNAGTGASGIVYTVAVQTDGKIIVAGQFFSFNGISKNKIVRLNADGTFDSTFNVTTGANNVINSCVIQPDGKIVISGDFSSFNSLARYRIARLNTDGTTDTTFAPTIGANNTIKTVCLQTDGKIIIGGTFTSYNGTLVNCIARLNADSTLDNTFNTGTGFNSSVNSVIIQDDGKVVVGGIFFTYNSTYCERIARLNDDGSIDAAFSSSPNSGTDGDVNTLVIQSNGKIMLGGAFSSCNYISRNKIASINTNGSIDTDFYPFLENGLSANGDIRAVALQADGKILIGGGFTTYSGIPSKRIARLNADGTLDATFNVGTGTDAVVKNIAVTSNHKVIITGDFKTYNGATANGIVQLNADGTLDTAFNSGGSGTNAMVNSLALQSDGKIIIGGVFSTVNGSPRNLLARLNFNGTVDTSFLPKLNAGNIWTISIQPDGKIIIAGLLLEYNYANNGQVLRLNANGSLDTTFSPGGEGPNYFVYSSAVQKDGKIVLAGAFNTFNKIPSKGVVRMNADGSLDTSFKIPVLYGNVSLASSVIQKDGKIIVGGFFPAANNGGSNIMRLNTDGTLDTDFLAGTGFNGSVGALIFQNDGKLLAGGNFGSYNETHIKTIARMNMSNTLSTDQFKQDSIIYVYPNPAIDDLKISLPEGIGISGYEVFDITGRKVDSNTLNSNFIKVTQYMQGIYFLRLKTDKGVMNAKFIKN
ncbi:T9SS type A sorting domain-containing protein [Flavobacterium geliluteum]|uniref:T9SS type A sorting domain-containing protein n=1 Tax=Flavobacterium geliluteum TaxID=2816120 RepID=A0A940X6W7_9FLAO|nr:T9SS type A sorting domain-containing protein [Flavobacterium geliluteum]MBP4137235.1 T9SS type A sorting domain-containing protein [Flavobacterium geliluteum]